MVENECFRFALPSIHPSLNSRDLKVIKRDFNNYHTPRFSAGRPGSSGMNRQKCGT